MVWTRPADIIAECLRPLRSNFKFIKPESQNNIYVLCDYRIHIFWSVSSMVFMNQDYGNAEDFVCF